jgi:hypothetical protein
MKLKEIMVKIQGEDVVEHWTDGLADSTKESY